MDNSRYSVPAKKEFIALGLITLNAFVYAYNLVHSHRMESYPQALLTGFFTTSLFLILAGLVGSLLALFIRKEKPYRDRLWEVCLLAFIGWEVVFLGFNVLFIAYPQL